MDWNSGRHQPAKETRHMTETQWDTFFDLLRQVVNLADADGAGMPWRDKRTRVREAAEERGADSDLEEFTGWFEFEK
jgi:hypothetical protein